MRWHFRSSTGSGHDEGARCCEFRAAADRPLKGLHHPVVLYICRSMKLTEQLEGLEFLGSRSSCLDGQMIAASKLKGSP